MKKNILQRTPKEVKSFEQKQLLTEIRNAKKEFIALQVRLVDLKKDAEIANAQKAEIQGMCIAIIKYVKKKYPKASMDCMNLFFLPNDQT